MKEQDKYNKLIQDKLDGFEFDYNAADWVSLSKRLPKKGFSPIYKVASIFVGASIIVAAAFYFNSDKNINQSTSVDTIQLEANNKAPNKSETNNHIDPETKITHKESKEVLPTAKNIDSQEQQNEKQQKTIPVQPEKASNSNKEVTKNSQPKSSEKASTLEQEITSNELAISNTSYCINDIIVITTEIPLTQSQIIKINGEVIRNLELVAKTEGEYTVSLFDQDTKIDTKFFNISPASKSNFIAAKKSEEFAKLIYNFESDSKQETNYTWSIDNIEVSIKPEFNKTFNRANNISVTLATENTYGCKSITTKTIQIEESFDIYSYDAFTPNGDGINDEFIPKAIEANRLKFEMMIYSVSGQLLYNTTDYTQPWNGRRNNDGELMPAGTYLWKVNLYDDNNEVHPHNGQIKIVNMK